MTDSALRDLERRALATNDPADWRAWYAARRRTGWDQPAGEATWLVVLPHGAQGHWLMFTGAVDTAARDLIAEVELEWKRCGTGVAVAVRIGAEGQMLVACPWKEAVYRSAFRIPLEGNMTDHVEEHLGVRLTLATPASGMIRVHGPAFLRNPVCVWTAPPERPDAPIRPDSRLALNPDVVPRGGWVEGVRWDAVRNVALDATVKERWKGREA